jgi:membrane protein implicated in regulation of membrane protease activity
MRAGPRASCTGGPILAGRMFVRYLAWQLPGWLLGAVGIGAATWALALPRWVIPAGVALLVVQDLLLYPAMRAVFQPVPPVRPVGARGVCVEALAPSGYVRVGGELWRARATGGPVPARRTRVPRWRQRTLTRLLGVARYRATRRRPGGGGPDLSYPRAPEARSSAGPPRCARFRAVLIRPT